MNSHVFFPMMICPFIIQTEKPAAVELIRERRKRNMQNLNQPKKKGFRYFKDKFHVDYVNISFVGTN